MIFQLLNVQNFLSTRVLYSNTRTKNGATCICTLFTYALSAYALLISSQLSAAPLPHFPDIKLQECFNEQAQLHNWQTAEDVDQLLCPNQGIHNIHGVEWLPNLIELNLSGNPLEHLNPLQFPGINNLKSLNISRTKLLDLQELTQLTALTHLLLNDVEFHETADPVHLEQTLNQILVNNSGLTHVGFNGFRLTGIHNTMIFNTLDRLPLKWLEISNTGITDGDMQMHFMQQLEYLDASNNELTDTHTFNMASNIETLNLANNDIIDVQGLIHGNLTALKTLSLFGNDRILCADINTLANTLSPEVKLTRPAYCPPPTEIEYCSAGVYSTSFEWIDAVALNGTDFQSGKNNGYADLTAVTFNLNKGKTNSIKLTPGFRSTVNYTESWAVWIDYNNNGVFEIEERAFSCQSQTTSIADEFIIPDTAVEGTVRMRIAMQWGNHIPVACGNYTWGEAEDYSVSISN